MLKFIKKALGIDVVAVDEEEYLKGLDKRTIEYVHDMKSRYWGNGPVVILPLPAMPSDGTSQCAELERQCKCKWEVKVIDAKKGDYDAYWILGDDTEDVDISVDKNFTVTFERGHCQTCIERSRQWNPLRIRKGMVR